MLPRCPILIHQGKPDVAPAVSGDTPSPRPCLLWALPPGSGQGPHPASTGALVPGTGHSPVLSLCQLLPGADPLAPGGAWAAATARSLPSCLPGTQLQGGSVTQRQTLRRKRGGLQWEFTQPPADPAVPAWILGWPTLTVPRLRLPPVLFPIQHLQLLQTLGH